MISLARKAKIIWQCRRGMLELDVIFQRVVRRLQYLVDVAELLHLSFFVGQHVHVVSERIAILTEFSIQLANSAQKNKNHLRKCIFHC